MCEIYFRNTFPYFVHFNIFLVDAFSVIRYNDKKYWLVISMTQQTPHNTIHAATRQLKIENCLLNNMLTIPYERISVADMCRQMGISRRLYYTYFPDKESCLLSLIDRYIYESIDAISFADITRNLLAQTAAYLSYWKEHSDFLSMVCFQNMKSLVIDRSHLYFLNQNVDILEHLSTPEVKADDTTLWLFAAFRFTVLLQWHEQGYKLPVEEMAQKYLRMLTSPLLHNL